VANKLPTSFDTPLGSRVIIWGRPGKTTLARAIAQKHDLTFIEADWINNLPGWKVRPPEQSREIVEKRIAESDQRWVYDGNPKRWSESTFASADSVILIQMPWLTTFWTYVKRGIRYSWTGEEHGGGNRETFKRIIASRESHICHIFKTRKLNYRALIEPDLHEGIKYYVIDSWKKLDKFYEIHDLPRNPSIDSREAASSWME